MNTFIKFIGIILLFGGILVVAGSGNDCDGKCMETANTISEMLVVAFCGLLAMGVGGMLLFLTNRETY
jgi:hypothetical protein